MRRSCLSCLALCAACQAADPLPTGALGIPIPLDGKIYAGAAVVDITPDIGETFTDLDGNAEFNGCIDNPIGGTEDCPEGFNDDNGNGVFDAVWLGGFSPLRPALSISDPLSVRALVLAHEGESIAFVSMDLIGVLNTRIHDARDRLAADGFDPQRVIVASTHNHASPDSLGFFGDPYDLSAPISGLDLAYQERIADAIEASVREAAAQMEAVEFRVGRLAMRDRSPDFNGEKFGGTNPTPKMHGLINDIRDPVIVSDQLLVLQGLRADDAAVFTFTNWSGHPEILGDINNAVSADYPGVLRDVLEDRYGGVALHFPEALGGMQSALGGDAPLVTPDGTHLMQPGGELPQWATKHTRDFVVSVGWHLAEAAIDAIEAGETVPALPITVERESFLVPLHNLIFTALLPQPVLDVGLEAAITDPAVCPEVERGVIGCFETHAFRIAMGPVSFATAPGEVLPELAYGLPTDDPIWVAESEDLGLRGPDSRYFPQHPRECDTVVAYEECISLPMLGDCDCKQLHNFPYTFAPTPDIPPVLDLLDTKYRAILGATDSFYGYVIPEHDFNKAVNVLVDDGDHYEETVSPSFRFATRWHEAHLRIAER